MGAHQGRHGPCDWHGWPPVQDECEHCRPGGTANGTAAENERLRAELTRWRNATGFTDPGAFASLVRRDVTATAEAAADLSVQIVVMRERYAALLAARDELLAENAALRKRDGDLEALAEAAEALAKLRGD